MKKWQLALSLLMEYDVTHIYSTFRNMHIWSVASLGSESDCPAWPPSGVYTRP